MPEDLPSELNSVTMFALKRPALTGLIAGVPIGLWALAIGLNAIGAGASLVGTTLLIWGMWSRGPLGVVRRWQLKSYNEDGTLKPPDQRIR